MGVMAFGLDSPHDLAIACGVCVCAWGPVQMLIAMKVILFISSICFLVCLLSVFFYSILLFSGLNTLTRKKNTSRNPEIAVFSSLFHPFSHPLPFYPIMPLSHAVLQTRLLLFILLFSILEFPRLENTFSTLSRCSFLKIVILV
jgi:hypothetical protein